MAGSDDPRIECAQCGKVYRWKPELAGKKVKCACGNKISVPRQDEPANESGTYELNFDDDEPNDSPPPRPAPEKKPEAKPDTPAKPKSKSKSKSDNGGKGRCPSCGNAVKAGAVICMNCGYNLQTGQKVETAVNPGEAGAAKGGGKPAGEVPKLTGLAAAMVRQKADQDAIAADKDKEHRTTEVYIPIGLFAGGVALLLIYELLLRQVSDLADIWGTSQFITRAILMGLDAFTVFIQIPFVFAGLFVTAAMFGSSYGPIIIATLKMLALVIFTTAISYFTHGLIMLITENLSVFGFEYMITWGAAAVAFFGIAMSMFEMDFLEAFVLYIIANVFPWIITGILLIAIIPLFF